MKVALHIHTTLSDGIVTPEDVLNYVKQNGCKICAITDHDIITTPNNTDGIIFLPSSEFTADDFSNFHILGYNIQNITYVRALYKYLNNFNEDKIKLIIRMLKTQNININYEEVKEFAQGNIINKSIIKRFLVVKRYVPSTKEAYIQYIGKGCPAYVKCRDFNAKFLLEMIRACGGISVLAHPTKIKVNNKEINERQLDILIGKLKSMGLNGIETYNANIDKVQNDFLIKLCNKYNLIPFAGADFHNMRDEMIIKMNDYAVKRFLQEITHAKNNYSIYNVREFHLRFAKHLLDINNKVLKENSIDENEYTIL